jgi:hypothetical protein
MTDDGDGWIDYERRTMWVGMFSLLFYCLYTYTFPFFMVSFVCFFTAK